MKFVKYPGFTFLSDAEAIATDKDYQTVMDHLFGDMADEACRYLRCSPEIPIQPQCELKANDANVAITLEGAPS